MPQRLAGDRAVRDGQKLLHRLEHRDLAAQTPPYAAEFESDDACADDAEARGYGVELQGVPGIDDVLAVVRRILQPNGRGTRRQYDMRGLQGFFGAVGGSHQDLVPRQQAPMPLDSHHAVRLEQRRDAAGHGLDHGSAALLHGREVELEVADLDAVDAELLLGALIEFRGFEQRLGRNAAGVETGAAERKTAVGVLPFVDAGHLQLVLRGANGGGIPGRSRADDDHIVDVAHTPSTMRAGSSRHCFTVTRNCTASRPSMIR